MTTRALETLRRCGWAALVLTVASFYALSLAWIYIRHGADAFYQAFGELLTTARDR